MALNATKADFPFDTWRANLSGAGGRSRDYLPGLVNVNSLLWKIAIFNGKTMGKPWENGDLYGKIHHFSWENPRFLNGHFQ